MTRDPANQEVETTEPAKKRKWLRRLLWVFVIFLISLPLINGPGFRWIAHWQINAQLEKLGFTGDTEVDGSFLSGIKLRNFAWKHEENATEFSGDFASVTYDLPAYFEEGPMAVVQEVQAEGVNLTLDLREPSPEDPESKGLKLDRLPQPRIFLESISANILLPDDKSVEVSELDLSLQPGQIGSLEIAHLTLPNGWEKEGIAAGVSYTDSGWVVSDLEIVDGVVIDRAEGIMTPGAPVTWGALADVRLWEASLHADWKQNESLSLSMTEGSLAFQDVLALLDQEIDISGRATGLDVQIAMHDSGNYRDWSGPVSVQMADVVYQELPVGNVTGDLQFNRGAIDLTSLRVLSGENEVLLSGSTALPAEGEGFETMQGAGNIRLTVRNSRPYLNAYAPDAAVGSLAGDIALAWRNGRVEDLRGSIIAETLAWSDWQIAGTELSFRSREGDSAWIEVDLLTQLNDENRVAVSVAANQESLDYNGSAEINLTALSTWDMPVDVAMLPERVEVDWQGSGSFEDIMNAQGEAELSVVMPLNEESQPVPTLDGRVRYDPEKVELLSLVGTWGEHVLELAGVLTEDGLDLTKLILHRGSLELASGTARIPLTEAEEIADRFWEAEEDLEVRLDTEVLDLADLTEGLGLEEPPVGTIEAHVNLSGRPASMGGTVSVEARQVGLASTEELAGFIDADLAVVLGEKQIRLDGRIKQERLPALVLAASMPFDPLNWEAAREAPIEASLNLPEADLSFIPEFVPMITRFQGTASAQMSVSGTVVEPIVSGSIELNAPQIVFEKNTIPDIRSLRVTLTGEGPEIVLRECQATVAGGGLKASGRVSLADGFENPPLGFDLQLSQLPLTRNESMIIRTNGSINIEGTLQEATISGRVGITESRLFREFEILPTEFPRRRSAAPPSAGIQRRYGIDIEPFNNWNIDLLVQSDEPFLVRTNVIAADVTMDFRLIGKLAAIYPEGEVIIDDAFGRLPFSEVDMERSTIRFDERTGFVGNLNLLGTSDMENYRITIRVRGSLNSPEPVLTSNPPLPEEEIYSLLATGTTREELLGNKNVAATKALVLVFDQLWRRFVDENWKGPKEMREKRLTIQADRVNARTGRNMTGARLRLTDRLFISGEADVEGDFRGLLHYIFRF